MPTINNKRIAKNTIALYLRMGFSMMVGLYTSRVVLNALGVVDYGLFGVVGGVIGMLGFLNMALSSSTQRYLNFNEGSASESELRHIFSTAVSLHLLIGLLVVLFLETIGLWFVYTKLNIPSSSFTAAVIVYHISVFSCFIGIITTPYSAAINAHEKMGIYAYFSMLDIILRLIVVFLLQMISSHRMVVYAVLCLAISLIMQTINRLYCLKHFKECKFIFSWDKPLLKSMTKFSGWMMWGCFSVILSSQGITLLINIFCGPIYNASRTIAGSVQGLLYQFSGNILAASKPQITKCYNEKDNLLRLLSTTTRATFFMMLLPAIPLLCYTQEILQLWLGEVPPQTDIFIRLLIVDTLIRSLTEPLAIANQAGGHVKWYQLTITVFFIFQFALAYILLSLKFPPYFAYIAVVATSVLGFFPRCLIVKATDYINLTQFFIKTLWPIFRVCIAVTLLICFYLFIIHINSSNTNWWELIVNSLVIIISTFLCILFLGFTKSERDLLYSKVILSTLNRIQKK